MFLFFLLEELQERSHTLYLTICLKISLGSNMAAGFFKDLKTLRLRVLLLLHVIWLMVNVKNISLREKGISSGFNQEIAKAMLVDHERFKKKKQRITLYLRYAQEWQKKIF